MVRITYGINNISVVQDSPDEKVDFELIPLPDSVHPKIVVRLSTVVPFQQQLTHLSEVEETAPSATKVCQQQIVPGSTAIELADPAPSDAVPEEKRIVPHGNMPNNLSDGEGQAADKAMKKINEAVSRCETLLKQESFVLPTPPLRPPPVRPGRFPRVRSWSEGDYITPTKSEANYYQRRCVQVDGSKTPEVEEDCETGSPYGPILDVTHLDPSASEHDEPMQMETQEYFTPRASPAKSIDTPDLNGSSEHTFCMAVSNESSQLELVGEKKDVSLSESDASTTDGPESELKTDNLNNKCEGKNGMMTTNESNDNNSSINSATRLCDGSVRRSVGRSVGRLSSRNTLSSRTFTTPIKRTVTKRSICSESSGQSPQLKIHRSVMSPGSQESFSPVLCSTRVIETKSEESIECTRGGVVASLSSSSSSTISTTTTTRTVSINLPPSPSLIQRQAKKDPKVAVDSILRQLNGSVNRHSIHTRLDELYAVLLTEIEDEKQTSIVNSLSTLRFPLRRMVRILGGTSAFDPMEVKKLLTRIRAAF